MQVRSPGYAGTQWILWKLRTSSLIDFACKWNNINMDSLRTISRWKYSMYLVCKSQHWVQHRDRDGKQTNQELDRCVRVCPSVTRQSCTDISEGGTKALFDIG